MPHLVRCSNILRYDNEAKKYVQCDHEFTASDNLAGATVECPKCGNEIQLPKLDLEDRDVGLLLNDGDLDFSDNPDAKPTDAEFARDNGEDSLAENIFASEPSDVAAAATTFADDELSEIARNQPPIQSPSFGPSPTSPLDSDQFAAADTKPPPATFGSTLQVSSFCPRCGGALPAEAAMCPSCGYHKELNRHLDNRDFADRPADDTGFQRWLRGAISEHESVDTIIVLFKIFIGLVVVGVLASLYLLIGPLALVFILPVVVYFVVKVVRKASQADADEDGAAAAEKRRGWWLFTLRAARLTGWREVGWPFRKRRVLNLRDKPINDDDLMRMPELDECVVLDLEGTNITDAGLTYLTGFRQLQFIVLRKTGVTPAGVARLQQSIRRAWIWH